MIKKVTWGILSTARIGRAILIASQPSGIMSRLAMKNVVNTA